MAERATVLGARRGSPVLTPAPSRGAEGPQVRAFPNVAA